MGIIVYEKESVEAFKDYEAPGITAAPPSTVGLTHARQTDEQ